ncbi:EcoAI/FtnUII family type I restriction enzme subunit R [Limnobacter sp.]|uniref:EcoAI/FtnUII family type I restriction enzme subunit R n=1 Tax=Pseudomonadota TaxID=1224 RepID=UPI003437A332
MNEAETRAEHIDPALAAAGWGIVEGSKVRREVITLGRIQGSGKRGKQDIADYVLEYRNRKLAVVEAKKWDAPHTEGVAQAKNYCGKLSARFGYSTNGQKIYAMDMQTGWEADVAAFPTPDELWDMVFAEANEWRDKFASIPFEDKGGLVSARYYQENAVNRVLDAVAEDKDRILLTLATGTGKTLISFQIAWKLFHSRWTLQKDGKRRPRILFLADRNILADQAFNAFSAFDDGVCVRIDPSEINKKGYVPTNGSIFFTIFQTFMSEGSGQPNYGAYPPDFFDFIIIDECHRGGANDEGNWRGILEYFSSAVQLGLTATPKRKTNADTYRYFGDPVYVYSLKEGINDGFLTPFRVVQIATTMDDYTYIPDDVVIEGEVEEGKRYEEKDFNCTIIIPERERKRVKVFMDAIGPNEKTIVFCATQEHALMIRDMINQVKKVPDANFCHRVTANDGALGEQHLRDFQDNDRTIPTILTTSQKLSTGVDARNVRNIVLMRPVNSMIEFKQIIGRGTRLYDGKDYFTIYDFVKAHHLFNDPEWDGDPIEPTGGTAGGSGSGNDDGTGGGGDTGGDEKPKKIVIKLADGKERLIQHMTATNFVGPDGKLLSAAQFIQLLYDTLSLPEYLKDEAQLREIWSDPATRKHLLGRLDDAGFGRDNLAAIQSIIEAENSDLFDVLQFVAYNKPTVPRAERVKATINEIHGELDERQQEFVDFVLSQYVELGVDELDREKLPQLISVKYGNLNDGLAKIGGIDQAMAAFLGSQRRLYQPMVDGEK